MSTSEETKITSEEAKTTGEETETASVVQESGEFNLGTLCFFILNLAIIIPRLVKSFSFLGLVGTIIILLAMFYVVVIRQKSEAAACRDLPVLLFFDVLVYLVTDYKSLLHNFMAAEGGILRGSIGTWPIILLLAGLVICVLMRHKTAAVWWKTLGKTLIGAAIVMQNWSDGEIMDPVFYRGGAYFLALVLLFAVAWFVSCVIAGYADPTTSKRNNRLANILLLVLTLLCTVDMAATYEFTDGLEEAFLAFPTSGLAWWKVLIVLLVLLAATLVAHVEEETAPYQFDSLFFGFAASGLVLLKVLAIAYFSFNWIIFLVFLLSAMRCLRNETKQAKTLKMSNPNFRSVQFAALLVATLLIKSNLWINVIILAVYAWVFYVTRGKNKDGKRGLPFWLGLLLFPVVFAMAYIWQLRFDAKESILLLLLAFAVAAGAMIILHWPYPDKPEVPKKLKCLLCLFMLVLCLIAMWQRSTRVHIGAAEESGVAEVGILMPNGENKLKSVSYYWSDATGEMIGTEQKTSVSMSLIAMKIRGEKLTVTITDSNGREITRTQWFPAWQIPR